MLRSARNDAERNNILLKGLDVVRQYAALLERGVQNSTRVRKVQVETRQANPLGRSMIEMLGVLAIIAVLSVGGIAGYSKAMTKFKINKTVNQITTIVSNISTLFANEKELPNFTGEIKSLIMPADILDNKSAFGGIFYVSSNGFGKKGYKNYEITLHGLSKEACTLLGSYDWGSTSGFAGIALLNTNRGNDNGGYSISYCPFYGEEFGKQYYKPFNQKGGVVACAAARDLPLPLTPALAAKGCDCQSDTCVIVFSFKE